MELAEPLPPKLRTKEEHVLRKSGHNDTTKSADDLTPSASCLNTFISLGLFNDALSYLDYVAGGNV